MSKTMTADDVVGTLQELKQGAMCENWKVKIGVDYVQACKKTEALSGKSQTACSVSLTERITLDERSEE